MKPAIVVKDLHKTYPGGIQALRGVDLEVKPGICFGLLGPNGAGKSTLVKCLLSIVNPSSGSASIRGKSIADERSRESVGYLPEGHRFPRYLTAAGVCRYYGRLAGLTGPKLEEEVKQKLDLVAMTEWADVKVIKFSKGMNQRVGVAQALMGDPEVVFLDEPTDGVDPMARHGLRNVIKAATERGAAVFINSHLLGELELLCDRVAIMNQGQIVHEGSVAEITAAAAAKAGGKPGGIGVRLRTSQLPEELWNTFVERGARREQDGYFMVSLGSEKEITPLIDELRAAQVEIYAVEPVRVRLEEAFVELIAQGGQAAPVGAVRA